VVAKIAIKSVRLAFVVSRAHNPGKGSDPAAQKISGSLSRWQEWSRIRIMQKFWTRFYSLKMAQKPDVSRTRQALWLANLTAVMIFGGLIVFLPGRVEISSLPEAQMPLLALALLSVPLAFLSGRLLRLDLHAPPQNLSKIAAQQTVSRFAVAGTLAELPAMLGLVYVMIGGASLIGLLCAAASLAAMLTLRPEAATRP
jgi:hypothetical protein